jgi:hypothetical protein
MLSVMSTAEASLEASSSPSPRADEPKTDAPPRTQVDPPASDPPSGETLVHEVAKEVVQEVKQEARATVERARQQTRESASVALRTGKKALDGVANGLREAEKRLEDEAKAWEAQADQAALPHVRADDPLLDLAGRVDREADYWRGLAVRSMRPGAARNLAVAGGARALVSGLALAGLGIVATMFGGTGPAAASATTAGGIALCAVVAGVLGAVAERGHARAAQAALVRADHAERRLERIAAIMALRGASQAKYVEALARLERER